MNGFAVELKTILAGMLRSLLLVVEDMDTSINDSCTFLLGRRLPLHSRRICVSA